MKHIKLYQQYIETEAQIDVLYNQCLKHKQMIVNSHGFSDDSMNLLKNTLAYKELREHEIKLDKLLNKIRKTEHYTNNIKNGDHVPTFIKESLK